MNLPRIPLFDWLVEHFHQAKYDLAMSSITGVPLSELQELTDFQIPKDLNLGYNTPFGGDELLDVLADMYHCEKNNVIPTTGGSEANFIAFLALVEPGDEVIAEKPGYSPLWLVPEMLGARIVDWERKYEDGFALDIEALKEKITKKTKLIVITDLHNPSGVLAEREAVKAAAEIASDNNAILFIDEMFLPAANIPQQTAFGMDSVVVTASVSKVYGIGGLRTGWIIAQDEIAKKCLLSKWQTTVAAPYLSELIIAAALANAGDKLVSRCKAIADQNFPIVNAWVEENKHLLDWVPPSGGVLCYPKFKTKHEINSVQLCEKIFKEQSVLLSPGKYFGTEDHFRLTFMNPEVELRAAFAGITAALQSL